MIKVACLQMWLEDGQSKEDRIKHAEKMIDSAAGSDLIVLPELWNIGWYSFDRYRELSETLEGETISRIAEKAKKVNAYIMAGTIVEKKNDLLYNTAVLLDPKGKVIAAFGKMHIPSMAGPEKQYITRNEKIVTVKTEIGVFGFGICYDLRFPELYRKMAVNHGVEIFLQPFRMAPGAGRELDGLIARKGNGKPMLHDRLQLRWLRPREAVHGA